MSIPKEEKFLTKRDLIGILRGLDRSLDGLQRKIKLYCIGSTELLFDGLRHSTKDVDFILSGQDFKVITGHIANLESKENIRIDLFPEGNMPGYNFSNYIKYSKLLGYRFDYIELYYLDKSVLILMKILSGRDRDLEDVKLLLNKTRLSKGNLEELYSSLKIDRCNKRKFARNFKGFIKNYFKD